MDWSKPVTSAPPTSIDGDGSPASSHATGLRPWRYALLAGLVVTLVRLLLVSQRTAMEIPSDEGSLLAVARSLGSNTPWVTVGTTRTPGFGVLLAPIHWFTSDPQTVYVTSLIIVSLLGGLSAFLLALVGFRLFSVRPWIVAAAAVVVSLLPGALFQTMWASSEALTTTVFMAVVLAALRFLDRPSPLNAMLAASLAAGSYLVHGRLALLLPAVLLIVGLSAVSHREVRRLLVPAVTAGVAVVLLSYRIDGWVTEQVWIARSAGDRIDQLLGRLSDVTGVALSALGMTWYQVVTTGGLAVVGIWALVGASLRGINHLNTGVTAPQGLSVLALTAAAAALAVLQMASGTRPEFMFYGRYWDGVAGPVLLVGLVSLASLARRRVVGAVLTSVFATIVLGSAFSMVRQESITVALDEAGELGAFRVVGIFALANSRGPIDVMTITWAAAGVLTLLGAASLWRASDPAARTRGFLAIAASFALAGNLAVLHNWGGYSTVIQDLNELENRKGLAIAVQAASIDSNVEIAMEKRGSELSDFRFSYLHMVYQYHLPTNTIRPVAETPEFGYLLAPVEREDLDDAGWTLLWQEPGASYGLWSRPEP